jgi:hypothetical protein
VQRRRPGEDHDQRVQVEIGEFLHGRHVPEALRQHERRVERLLQLVLLIQRHPDEQGERVLGQQLVGFGVDRQRHRHGAYPAPSRRGWTSPVAT